MLPGDDACHDDTGQRLDGFFHLAWEDVVSPGLEDLSQPARQADGAVRVAHAQVGSLQVPVYGEGVRGGLRVTQVGVKDARPSDLDLPDGAHGQLGAGLRVCDAYLPVGIGDPDCPNDLVDSGIGRCVGDATRCLGHPVEVVKWLSEAGEHLGARARHGTARPQDPLHGRQVSVPETRIRHEVEQHRGNSTQQRRLRLLNRPYVRSWGELLKKHLCGAHD